MLRDLLALMLTTSPDELPENPKDQLTEWEREYIAGLIRIGASGKGTTLTEAQAKTLTELYYSRVLRAFLPEALRVKKT